MMLTVAVTVAEGLSSMPRAALWALNTPLSRIANCEGVWF